MGCNSSKQKDIAESRQRLADSDGGAAGAAGDAGAAAGAVAIAGAGRSNGAAEEDFALATSYTDTRMEEAAAFQNIVETTSARMLDIGSFAAAATQAGAGSLLLPTDKDAVDRLVTSSLVQLAQRLFPKAAAATSAEYPAEPHAAEGRQEDDDLLHDHVGMDDEDIHDKESGEQITSAVARLKLSGAKPTTLLLARLPSIAVAE